jgi:trans-aconitate methyltransferase
MLAEEALVADESYYTHARPEVLRLVPSDVRQVVDVGCAAGALGASIKQRSPDTQVRGIEIVPEQALRAREVLDDAVALGADDPMPAHWPAPDCVIFADVLEHLVDPWSVLRHWRQRVQAGAWIIVSLPNVTHVSIVADLLRGRWTYADEGLLDRTHLRFFSRQGALDLIEQADFRVESVSRSPLVPDFLPARKTIEGWALRATLREAAQPVGSIARTLLDLLTFEFLITARAKP